MPSEGRDPSGYITQPPSVVVKVTGTARNDINGLMGIAISYNLERERYLVHMTQSQSTMALKKENLAKASMMESYRAQWQQLQNDPRVREKMAHYLTLCQQHVAPMRLSHIVGGVMAVWIPMLYFLGLTKTIMTTSLLILLIIIAGPDLLVRSAPQVVMQNFPERARQMMEKQMPFLRGKLTNRMAVGVVMFLIALCLQSLFLTSGAKPNTLPPPVTSSSSSPLMTQTSLEKYYNLGFEDATEGREHGTSLKEEISSLKELLEEDLGLEDEHVFDLEETEGRTKKEGILAKLSSLTNVGSIFYLYRSVVELGTEQTTNLFSLGQLAANMQHHTEWWRKALLVLSIYNVFRIFL